jgi:hypothetical protein
VILVEDNVKDFLYKDKFSDLAYSLDNMLSCSDISCPFVNENVVDRINILIKKFYEIDLIQSISGNEYIEFISEVSELLLIEKVHDYIFDEVSTRKNVTSFN